MRQLRPENKPAVPPAYIPWSTENGKKSVDETKSKDFEKFANVVISCEGKIRLLAFEIIKKKMPKLLSQTKSESRRLDV